VKIVLMVAAGIAVGLTVVLAVLVQVVAALLEALERLTPLLVALAVLALVLHVVRRRRGERGHHPNLAFPLPATPLPSFRPEVPVVIAPELPCVADDQPYLRRGPRVDGDLDAPPVTYNAGARVAPTRAGTHPSRPGRGRRP
jgi:hypothetical protein